MTAAEDWQSTHVQQSNQSGCTPVPICRHLVAEHPLQKLMCWEGLQALVREEFGSSPCHLCCDNLGLHIQLVLQLGVSAFGQMNLAAAVQEGCCDAMPQLHRSREERMWIALLASLFGHRDFFSTRVPRIV
jgi:hypothetical protein